MRNVVFLKENIIAHRGFHNKEKGIPENSLVAFSEAIKNNYIIELDIHLLKDGNIVVFHDDNLIRMTGVNKLIKDCTYEEIKKLKLYGTNHNVPLLKEVLNLIDNKVPLILELKTDNKVGKLEEKLMEEISKYTGKYVVKSFNPLSVYWFKRYYPEIIRGQLSYDFEHDSFTKVKKIILKNMLLNFITKPDFISYGIKSLPNKRVQKFRKRKLVLGWTITNNNDYEYAKRYCDNFICENIDNLNIVLTEKRKK